MGTLTLIGSLLANWVSSHIPTGKLIILSLAFDTLCFIPLIFFHSYTAVLISLSLMGLPLPSLNTGLYGFIFGKTPDTMQGRATAVFETAVGIFGAVTPAAIGPVLQLQYGFTITAVIAAVFAAVSLVISIATSLRTVPRPEKWEDTDLRTGSSEPFKNGIYQLKFLGSIWICSSPLTREAACFAAAERSRRDSVPVRSRLARTTARTRSLLPSS